MPDNDKPASEKKRRSVWRQSFDRSLLVFALLASASGFAVYWFNGEEAFRHTLDEAWDLLLFIIPRVGAAVLIAAFLQILVPREVVSRLIGEKAGIGSVLIATVAGIFTPGGPLTSFPIVIALYSAGANKGALVAYLSAWAMVGLQRTLVWELPLMGPEFTMIRVGSSLILPVIAGTIALYLPIRLKMPDTPEV
ncbi:MAG: hypothetical protein HOM58_14400 [Rhodospirillaceae bacterium]|jgi:hypothetical protein|nr:hypothetical protein [Rhodospirillaceae bacterium]MBT5455911.1 hypothetical protein [Rhodospirillaceae bacterium]